MMHEYWEMLLCDQGAIALITKQNRIIRVCFQSSAADVLLQIKKTCPHARQSSPPLVQEGLKQLSEYFAGERRSFNLPIAIDFQSAFTCRVQKALLKVAYGKLVSYRDLAVLAESPGASRAVGRVMSTNPFPLLVPCHRVVHADGSIGQYSAANGPETKAWLIDFEQAGLCG